MSSRAHRLDVLPAGSSPSTDSVSVSFTLTSAIFYLFLTKLNCLTLEERGSLMIETIYHILMLQFSHLSRCVACLLELVVDVFVNI